MKNKVSQGVRISQKDGIQQSVKTFLKSLLEKEVFDAILIPLRVPAGDSFAWVLVKDPSLLDDAWPLAPIMPVQGAKALKSLTRKGKGKLQIAALMRPCEIRASVELSKLNQVHLDNITLMSMDCPGALPMAGYLDNPQKGDKQFESMLSDPHEKCESAKTVCQGCDHFSLLPSSDFHFGFMTGEDPSIFLIPNTPKGQRILKESGLKAGDSLANWAKRIDASVQKQKKRKQKNMKDVQSRVEGFDGLLETFAACIGCHNCQSACPICYCRQCYFDSETSKLDLDFILQKAKRRGGLSFPLDKRMFHVGRLSHMSLSCVACGLCSDACPVSIPVAEVFSYVADHTQQTFEYTAGEDREAVLPIQQFRLEEIQGVEKLIKDAEEVECQDE